MIWPGDRWCLSANAKTFGCEIGPLSSGDVGRPNGVWATNVTLLASVNLINSFSFLRGWHLIWFITGLILACSSKRVNCSALKFETPMLRTRPLAYILSISRHVSMKSTSANNGLPAEKWGEYRWYIAEHL